MQAVALSEAKEQASEVGLSLTWTEPMEGSLAEY